MAVGLDFIREKMKIFLQNTLETTAYDPPRLRYIPLGLCCTSWEGFSDPANVLFVYQYSM